MLKRPFFLGKLKLSSNIFCAPLAGCSDFPFRQLTSSYKPGLIYCEMVKMDALVRHDFHTYQMLDYDTSMHPIGAQLCGSKVELASSSAKILEDLGFDTIDLNCGCPVDKVTKDGSGSGLLKNLDRLGAIIDQMVRAVEIPVTVKIRAGWDENSIVAPEIIKIAEQAGATSATVHGRTREQAYKGPANKKWIKESKMAAKSILVVGNGDLMEAKDVFNMFKETDCDAVLIARGTLGSPWIIEDIYRYLEGKSPIVRTAYDYRDALIKHLHFIERYYPSQKAAMHFRRIGCWYLKNGTGVRQLRELLNKSRTAAEVRDLIYHYPWEKIQFSSTEAYVS